MAVGIYKNLGTVGITPTDLMHLYLIEALGRAGRVSEAEEFVTKQGMLRSNLLTAERTAIRYLYPTPEQLINRPKPACLFCD